MQTCFQRQARYIHYLIEGRDEYDLLFSKIYCGIYFDTFSLGVTYLSVAGNLTGATTPGQCIPRNNTTPLKISRTEVLLPYVVHRTSLGKSALVRGCSTV